MISTRDLTKQEFGDYTALYKCSQAGPAKWMCQCACGSEVEVLESSLVRGRSLSCRPCGWKRAAKARVIHGGTGTRLYSIWESIKGRTTLASAGGSKYYLGRGIGIDCPEWAVDFTSFRDWALANGYSDELEIDRKDNDKGYSLENCRWVTDEVNANNRSVSVLLTAFGETMSATQWERDPRSRVTANVMRHRKKMGWMDWDAVCVPSKKEVRYY